MECVSIIVPVYNVEEYLERCIKSILSQTYKNIEILLIDDGSTDSSREICDYYQTVDNRIKVFHKSNGGLSDARNFGIEKSNGDYLTFLDSDDWIDKYYVEKLLLLCQKYDADISICNYLATYNEMDVINRNNAEKILLVTNHEAMKYFFTKYNTQFTIACAKLYSKSLFNNIRFPYGKLHEDEFTTYKLLYAAKKIVFTEEQLLFYWQRSDGIMGKKENLKNKIHLVEAFNERLLFFENQGLNKEYNLLVKHIISFFMETDKKMYLFKDDVHNLNQFHIKKEKLLKDINKNLLNMKIKVVRFFYLRCPIVISTLKILYQKIK